MGGHTAADAPNELPPSAFADFTDWAPTGHRLEGTRRGFTALACVHPIVHLSSPPVLPAVAS